MSRLTVFVKDHSGASALEFAIVLPFLLICILGILGFGTYLGAAHGVQQLAAEAARASISGLSDAERTALAEARIQRGVNSYPFLSSQKLVVQSAETDAANRSFTITLAYDASSMPIFKFPYLPLPPTTISRSATIQRGGF